MISKTHGIALRIDPYSKTSHIISWLTPDKGRLSMLAKGAMRPRSLFLGQYDLFYTCELIYYPGVRSALGTLKECTPLNSRDVLRENWKSCVATSYFADLVHHITPTGVSNVALYKFVGHMIDFLSKNGANLNTLHWAELKLLSMLGVGPQLITCVACGSSEFKTSATAAFSIPRGGLLCALCNSIGDSSAVHVSHDALAMLRLWQQAASPLIAKRTSCTDHQQRMIDKLLGGFMSYHVETSRARDIAMGML